MSVTVAGIEARIKEYETAISNSLANHNGLVGALSELQRILSVAKDVAEVVAPAVEPVLAEIENVVGEVDNALSPAAS